MRSQRSDLTRRRCRGAARHAALALGCAGVVLTSFGGTGAAAPRKSPQVKVVIVTLGTCCPGEAWATAERRVAAELRTLGLAVRMTPSAVFGDAASTRRNELDELGRRLGASAVLLIHRPTAGRSTSVWIWQATTPRGKHDVRTLVISGRASRSSTLLALQLAEQVRSRPLVAAPPPKRRAREARRVPPPRGRLPTLPFRRAAPGKASDRAPARPRHWRDIGPWSIRLGMGVKASSDRKHSHVHARLTLSWYPLPFLAADLSVAASFAGEYEEMRIQGENSEFSFGFVETRFWLRWEILSRGRLRPSIGVGAGPLYIYAPALLPGLTKASMLSFWVAEVAFAAQVAVGITRLIWLRITLEFNTNFPTESSSAQDPKPVHPNPAVASFGRPWMWGLALALEVRLP